METQNKDLLYSRINCPILKTVKFSSDGRSQVWCSATVREHVKCFSIEPALGGLRDVRVWFCSTWAHLETVRDRRKDGKWRWSGGMAESRYHRHSRSDNDQLLFTISPSEEVRDEGEAGGTHRGNHLIKGRPPARPIIPRIPQYLTLNKSMWRGYICKKCSATDIPIQNSTRSRQISAWRSVISHDTFRRAFLEAAVSWRVPGVKRRKDEGFNQSESGHGRPARERPFALPQLQSFG